MGGARQTQAERRALTRARLLDATVECLSELGWSGTTTTAVANRSGLSRGAQLHYFPTKADLVAAAVEHVFEARLVEFRQRLTPTPSDPPDLSKAIGLIWELFQGPTFEAWLELTVAGRTEGELGERIAIVSDTVHRLVTQNWNELFPGFAAELGDVGPYFLFSLFNGMALNRISGARSLQEYPDQVLALVESLIALIPQEETT